jgi:NAD(P)-dependent dehydrogenase (short-subunit alcohol dehydrogenase family)
MAQENRTAIVTGASQGIGAGLVKVFAERGLNVVANSRRISDLKEIAASSKIALVNGNIGDPTTAQQIVDTAQSRFGRVDVLVNTPVFSSQSRSPITPRTISSRSFQPTSKDFSISPNW